MKPNDKWQGGLDKVTALSFNDEYSVKKIIKKKSHFSIVVVWTKVKSRDNV